MADQAARRNRLRLRLRLSSVPVIAGAFRLTRAILACATAHGMYRVQKRKTTRAREKVRLGTCQSGQCAGYTIGPYADTCFDVSGRRVGNYS